MVIGLYPSIFSIQVKAERKMGISDIEFLEVTNKNFEKLRLAYEDGKMTPEAEKYYLNLVENKERILQKL